MFIYPTNFITSLFGSHTPTLTVAEELECARRYIMDLTNTIEDLDKSSSVKLFIRVSHKKQEWFHSQVIPRKLTQEEVQAFINSHVNNVKQEGCFQASGITTFVMFGILLKLESNIEHGVFSYTTCELGVQNGQPADRILISSASGIRHEDQFQYWSSAISKYHAKPQIDDEGNFIS
jgi:hypothetical protein